MYRSIDPIKIISTIAVLQERIQKRFPNSGLSKVSRELLQVGREAKFKSEAISKPNLGLRVLTGLAIIIIILGLHMSIQRIPISGGHISISEFIQVLEAGLNDIVLIGAAIFFLVTFETRIKRERCLKLLHELRVLAHVVDMHQLTKDPEKMLGDPSNYTYPPEKRLSRFELNRYFDYCSEMLSMIGKISALYIQCFNDPVVVSAVNEIEELTTGLSRKIWQKIMILQTYD